MYEEILVEVKARPQPPDFVFLTGDLAFAGTAEEYDLLNRRFLTPLRNVLPTGCLLFMVPGNHDVDRLQSCKPRLWMSDAKERDAFQDIGVEGQRKRVQLLQPRFKAYCALEEEFADWGQDWIGSQQGSICKVVTVRDHRVAIIGINTAWLCQDDEDWGRLTAGRAMLDAALRQSKAEEPELTVVLGHHPLTAMTGERDWSDGERLRQRLEQANAIYLHGHLHTSGQQRTGDSLQSVVALQAPSAFQAADSNVWRNGLLWTTADIAAARLIISPKRWNNDHQAYVFDSDCVHPRFRVRENDAFSFALPGKLVESPAVAGSDGRNNAPPQSPDDSIPTPAPALHYVRKPYIERQPLVGRETELAYIDRWATDPHAMLIFQGIGGMGKSMLTWHWLKARACAIRSDWAGRLWYSFYEEGASLNDFCVEALAYIRHQPPRTFRNSSTVDLGQELRRELDARPWLLVLDGLERVMVAYNMSHKQHHSDVEVQVLRDPLALDRKPRSCFRPEDDEVLQFLAQAERGKLLVSSRLTPAALINSMGQLIPGVRKLDLEGLQPEDAYAVLHAAGVRGDRWRIQRFLQDKFACHPLSVRVIAGRIRSFVDAPDEFERWVEHPDGGADPQLVALDLEGRQNHILAQALRGLTQDAMDLLSCVAIVNVKLTTDVLRIINPRKPTEPASIAKPVTKAPYSGEGSSVVGVRKKRTSAVDQSAYESYLAAHHEWQEQARAADRLLLGMLAQLEQRGLVQYDATSGLLDMHPAIRHAVLAGISPELRRHAGSHVSDALSSRSVKALNEAHSLADLALVRTRVEALNMAGKFPESWQIYCFSGLRAALGRLLYSYETLEILHPYFPSGWEKGPSELPAEDQTEALRDVAFALLGIGHLHLSHTLTIKATQTAVGAEDAYAAARALIGLGVVLQEVGSVLQGRRALSLAARLVEAAEAKDLMRKVKLQRLSNALWLGQLAEAEPLLNDLLAEQKLEGSSFTSSELAQILAYDLWFRREIGRFDLDFAEQVLGQIRALGERRLERTCLAIIVRSHLETGNHLAGLERIGDMIALAHDIRSSNIVRYEAVRGVFLARIGRTDEAERIAKRFDREAIHSTLARLHLALGNREKAAEHARSGYIKSWGDGPGAQDADTIRICRAVLVELGLPEPEVGGPRSSVKPFEFEADLERLIQKLIAKNARAKLARTSLRRGG